MTRFEMPGEGCSAGSGISGSNVGEESKLSSRSSSSITAELIGMSANSTDDTLVSASGWVSGSCTPLLAAIDSSSKCEYRGAKSNPCTFGSFNGKFPKGEPVKGGGSLGCRAGGCVRRRVRGVKSGTTDSLGEAMGQCRPGVGGAMLPDRCFFCNARVRIRRLSLQRKVSQKQ